jgi:hypothetical protein
MQWHTYIYKTYRYSAVLSQPLPLLPVPHYPILFCTVLANPHSYLLGEPAFLALGANTHPLLSLVCYQLFSPCCFTHPKAPQRSSYIFTQTTSTTSAVSSDTFIHIYTYICVCVFTHKFIQLNLAYEPSKSKSWNRTRTLLFVIKEFKCLFTIS